MLRHLAVSAIVFLSLASGPLRGEATGQQELARGREAMARRDYAAAVEHLGAAVRALDAAREREAAADAWLQLGLAQLTGLGRAEGALEAFTKSAGLAWNPATAWLWASVAAEKLGRWEEAGSLKARALSPAPPVSMAAAAAAPPAAAPAAPAEKPDAFQHFFGEKKIEEKRSEEKPPS